MFMLVSFQEVYVAADCKIIIIKYKLIVKELHFHKL